MMSNSLKIILLVFFTLFFATILLFNSYSHAYPQGPFTWGIISPSHRILADGHVSVHSYVEGKMGTYAITFGVYHFVPTYLTTLISIAAGLTPETTMSIPIFYMFSGLAFYALALKFLRNHKYAYLSLILFMFGDAGYLTPNRVISTYPVAMFVLLCILNCLYSYHQKRTIYYSITIIVLIPTLILAYYSLSYYALFLVAGSFLSSILCAHSTRANKKHQIYPIIFLIFAMAIIYYNIIISPTIRDVIYMIQTQPSPMIAVPLPQWTAIRPLLIFHMIGMILASLPAAFYLIYLLFIKKRHDPQIFLMIGWGFGAAAFFMIMLPQPYFGLRGFSYSYFLMSILSVFSFQICAKWLDKRKRLFSTVLSSITSTHMKRLLQLSLLIFIALQISITYQVFPTMQNIDVYSTTETVTGAMWINDHARESSLVTTQDYASILYGSFNYDNLIFVSESNDPAKDDTQFLFYPKNIEELNQIMTKYNIECIVIGYRSTEFGFRHGREFRDPIPISSLRYYDDSLSKYYDNGETWLYAGS